MKYDAAVFIGRFQPFHNGHLHVIKEAMKIAKEVIIVVGSSDADVTLRNPLTFLERLAMIDHCLHKEGLYAEGMSNIRITKMKDCESNDQWKFNLNMEIDRILHYGSPKNKGKIALIGFKKDETSFYLDFFPQWDFVEVDKADVINATDIREAIWELEKIKILENISWEAFSLFVTSDNFKKLQTEYMLQKLSVIRKD